MSQPEPRVSEDEQTTAAAPLAAGDSQARDLVNRWAGLALLDYKSAVYLRVFVRGLYALMLTAAAVGGVVLMINGQPPAPFLLHAGDVLTRAWQAAH
jgi:hypothetical protein